MTGRGGARAQASASAATDYFRSVARSELSERSSDGRVTEMRRLIVTYETFAAYWPNAPEEEQVIAVPLNTRPKYVASTTLTEPLAWENSTLLHGDVAEAVAALKHEEGDDLHVIGRPQVVQTLVEHDLVDELALMIDPLVLGGGKRLFRDDRTLRPLRLVDSQTTSTGAIIATYAPAEA
jgi:dihydrofolate reductase